MESSLPARDVGAIEPIAASLGQANQAWEVVFVRLPATDFLAAMSISDGFVR
jgi:hypothetical protein